MIWKSMVSVTTILLLVSIVSIGAVFWWKEAMFPKLHKICTKTIVVISIGLFIWILFNKELFHWNYDIATGEPVDHYSTYHLCLIKTGIAGVISIVSIILCNTREKTMINSSCTNDST